jgi:hypothetical protein
MNLPLQTNIRGGAATFAFKAVEKTLIPKPPSYGSIANDLCCAVDATGFIEIVCLMQF